MRNFNKKQRQELIEFIDKTASSFDFNAFGILGILLVLQLDIPWEWKGMLSLLYLISSLDIEEESNNG